MNVIDAIVTEYTNVFDLRQNFMKIVLVLEIIENLAFNGLLKDPILAFYHK